MSLDQKIFDINKLVLSVAILLSSVILGSVFYKVQINKQESIERQQGLELQEKRRVEEAKAQQTKKEYQAKRRTDCLAIYKTEGAKWNNVRGWRYSESDDECFIAYKEAKPKSDAKCDESYPIDNDLGLTFFRENLLCKQGEFENSF